MKYLIKIDRLAAWALLGSILTYFISGYGMTKGIIDPVLALNLHTKYLPTVIILSFAIHTSYAIHLALKRWRIWNIYTKTSLIFIYVLIVTGFLYLEYSYIRPIPASSNTQSPSTITQTTTTGEKDDENGVTVNTQGNTGTQTQTAAKTFTAAELTNFNGKNGQPAYVAVDGSVYDVTRLFASGFHFTHFAGKDLTNEFYSQHAKSKLANYPIVGQLK
jgi:predicted heme/steroid binding protein